MMTENIRLHGLLHGGQGGTDGKRCLQEDDKVAWPGTSCFSTSN